MILLQWSRSWLQPSGQTISNCTRWSYVPQGSSDLGLYFMREQLKLGVSSFSLVLLEDHSAIEVLIAKCFPWHRRLHTCTSSYSVTLRIFTISRYAHGKEQENNFAREQLRSGHQAKHEYGILDFPINFATTIVLIAQMISQVDFPAMVVLKLSI